MKQRIQKIITLNVNGRDYDISVGEGRTDMPESETLADTLRDRLGFTGLKVGCGQGACGACTVIMNGKAVTSCMMLTMDCDGARIVTIEGLADAVTGELSGLQRSFVDNCGYQCGFCTPGIIMTAQALLEKNPEPTEERCARLWRATTAAAAPITAPWNPSWLTWKRKRKRKRKRGAHNEQ